VHEGEGERKMREFKEKILSEEQAGRGEVAKTKESTKPGMMRKLKKRDWLRNKDWLRKTD